MKFYPSILEGSTASLREKLTLLLPHFDYFQIDIADGQLVSSKTVQIEEIAREVVSWGLAVSGKAFEFHLMVKNWQEELPKLEALSVHWDIDRILIHAPVFDPTLNVQRLTFNAGLVLNPEDTVTEYIETILQVPAVQLMTVHPGAQGTPFVPQVLDKIDELREEGFAGEIILDGAINDKTLPIIVARKNVPDAACPGSYFGQDVENRLKRLQKILHNPK